MSTNCECMMVEKTPGEWFYILENYNAPKNSWNWIDHAEAYGPFASEDDAAQHLSDNHANPGGWSIMTHDQFRESESMARVLKDARENLAATRRRRHW